MERPRRRGRGKGPPDRPTRRSATRERKTWSPGRCGRGGGGRREGRRGRAGGAPPGRAGRRTREEAPGVAGPAAARAPFDRPTPRGEKRRRGPGAPVRSGELSTTSCTGRAVRAAGCCRTRCRSFSVWPSSAARRSRPLRSPRRRPRRARRRAPGRLGAHPRSLRRCSARRAGSRSRRSSDARHRRRRRARRRRRRRRRRPQASECSSTSASPSTGCTPSRSRGSATCSASGATPSSRGATGACSTRSKSGSSTAGPCS